MKRQKVRVPIRAHHVYWTEGGRTLTRNEVPAWFCPNEKVPIMQVLLNKDGDNPRQCVDINLADMIEDLKMLGLVS